MKKYFAIAAISLFALSAIVGCDEIGSDCGPFYTTARECVSDVWNVTLKGATDGEEYDRENLYMALHSVSDDICMVYLREQSGEAVAHILDMSDIPFAGTRGDVSFAFSGKKDITFNGKEIKDVQVELEGSLKDKPKSKCSPVPASYLFGIMFDITLTIPAGTEGGEPIVETLKIYDKNFPHEE